MEHDGTHEEQYQRAILEKHPDAFHFAALLAVLSATGEFVINFAWPDHQQDENRGNRESHNKEKDTSVRHEIAEEAHRHGGHHVSCRVERLIATLADIKRRTSD